MDADGILRPGTHDYPADCRLIASGLEHGQRPIHVLLADRATKYDLTIIRGDVMECVGDHDLTDGLTMDLSEWLFIAVRDHGCGWLRRGAYQAPSYLSNLLGITWGDGEVLGEFLSAVDAAGRLRV